MPLAVRCNDIDVAVAVDVVHVGMAAFGRGSFVVVDAAPIAVGDAVADEDDALVIGRLGAGNGRQTGQDDD